MDRLCRLSQLEIPTRRPVRRFIVSARLEWQSLRGWNSAVEFNGLNRLVYYLILCTLDER